MKKLALLALCFLLTSSAAFAAEWQIKKQGDETIYVVKDRNILCGVIIGGNSIITVAAADSDWNGKIAEQIAQISKGSVISNDVLGYWVFSAKCVDLAKDLPEDVRKKFDGTFGIN